MSNELHAELESIRDRAQSIAANNSSASATYGNTIVRSTIQVNAISLIAIPAYLLTDATNVEPSFFFWPALIFVLGVITGGLCGFCAFRNFYHLGYAGVSSTLLQVTNSYRIVYDNFDELNPEWVKDYDQAENEVQTHARRGLLYEHLAVLFGTISAVCFAAGWLISGYVILSDHAAG